LENKDNGVERKKFIFKIKNFEKNTNTEKNENSENGIVSSFDEKAVVDNISDIYSIDEESSDEESSQESISETDSDELIGENQADDNYDNYESESSIPEHYKEIYSYSDKNNEYLGDRDFDNDIRHIIENLDVDSYGDASLEEDVDGILEDADTDFEEGDDFEENVRQVFRSMRAEGDTDEEDIDLILESVNKGEESEKKDVYSIYISRDLDMILADIRSYIEKEENKENKEITEVQEVQTKKKSRPSKRERIDYDEISFFEEAAYIEDSEDYKEEIRYKKERKNGKKYAEENEEEEPRPRVISSEVLRKMVSWLITVAALTVLLTMLFMPVLQIYGTSMSPLLEEGDILLTFRTSDFKKGDIISFYYNNKILVKRVIAFEGDFVNIKNNGSVYVNNKELKEDYISEKALGDCDITLPYQVPSGKIFVLGDHRLTSVDSRNKAMGCVSQEQISGKPVFRVWPLNRMGFVEN